MKINYKLLARIRKAKDEKYLPSNVCIDYRHLGKVLEAKAKELKRS